MPDNEGFYIVSTYYYSSEATYMFGPFTREQAEKAYDKIYNDSTCEPPMISYVNHQHLFGTGLEVSA